MVALRLVRVIERNSEKIAEDLVEKIQASPRTSALQAVPESELIARMREPLQHLSDWLLTKTQSDIESRYRDLGARRADQGVPLSQVCWALIISKEYLWEFLQKQGFLHSPVELYGEIELLWLLEQFFDRALWSVVEGYSQSQGAESPKMRRERPKYAEVNLANLVP